VETPGTRKVEEVRACLRPSDLTGPWAPLTS